MTPEMNRGDEMPKDESMNGEMGAATERGEDAWVHEIAELLQAEPVPEHRPDFWDEIDAGLISTPVLVAAPPVGASIETESNVDLLVSADAAGRGRPRSLVLVAAAACLAVLGLGAWWAVDATTEETTVFAGSDDDYSSRPQPVDDEGRAIVNPLIDLSQTKSSRGDTALFMVESGLPLRLRSTVLDQFGGGVPEVWTASGDFAPVDGSPLAPEFFDPSAMVSSFMGVATIQVLEPAFDSPWLPSPGNLTSISALDGGTLLFEPRNEVVVAGSDTPSRRYTASFAAPVTGPGMPDFVVDDALQAQLDPYLELPEAWRELLVDELNKFVVEGDTDTNTARRMEVRFRQIDVGGPMSAAAGPLAVSHLLEFNAGSHERIVGSFAAMARAAGLPSRIVVGFDEGERLGGRDDLWTVHGRNAAAWVELFVDGRWRTYDPAAVRPEMQAPLISGAPQANLDHWHAIFAIYDCATNSYMPPLMSERDEYGIHSHQDGLIAIHPWSDESAGENATLGLFFETMGLDVGPANIVAAEDGFEVRSTDSCPDGSIVHLRKWRFDVEAQIAEPEVVTANIGDVRFKNDREVYVLAVAPLDAELPPIPDELFARLNEWLQPVPSDDPRHPSFTSPSGSIPSVVTLDEADVDDAVLVVPGPERDNPEDAVAAVTALIEGDGGDPMFGRPKVPYIVEAGDTWASLALKFTSPEDRLRDANDAVGEPTVGEEITVFGPIGSD